MVVVAASAGSVIRHRQVAKRGDAQPTLAQHPVGGKVDRPQPDKNLRLRACGSGRPRSAHHQIHERSHQAVARKVQNEGAAVIRRCSDASSAGNSLAPEEGLKNIKPLDPGNFSSACGVFSLT